MNIVCISDLHGHLPELPSCDLLIIAGDICPVANHTVDRQQRWLKTEFRQWLEVQNADRIVGVWGNHDLIAESHPERLPLLPWDVLTDELITVHGLRIYGMPWQRRFYDWAFNLDEPDLDAKYAAIPDCDVIVSHGPPFSYGDCCENGQVGSQSLLARIDEIKPKLVVYGHIHEGAGFYQRGESILVNASVMDGEYRPKNPIRCVKPNHDIKCLNCTAKDGYWHFAIAA